MGLWLARRNNRLAKKPEVRQIRMQMHATDPQFLEQRLGNPASQGCIRLSAETNQFIDNHAIIDKKIEDSSQSWTLKKDRTPVSNQGSFVLVVNTDNAYAQLATPVVSNPVSLSTTSVTVKPDIK